VDARIVISFEVEGVEYMLALKMPALKAYQRTTGETALAAFQAIEADPGDMVRLSALFRAACTPEVSEEEADAIMDAIGLGAATKLLADAAQAAFPSADPNPQTPPE
jgi:hypothetical protein